MDYDTILELVAKRFLTPEGIKRFAHIEGVIDTAILIAKAQDADIESARIAAILHDCTKHEPETYHREMILKYFGTWPLETYPRPLWHAFSAVGYAKDVCGIVDEDILNAILYHTTGRAAMSKLEKIIYIADYVEPGRHFPTKHWRELALKDLDAAMAGVLAEIIVYEREVGHPIMPLSEEAFAYYNLSREERNA